MITFSRNTPVAFVVGGAGFLGSHLVERFLDQGIQVVAIDDLSSGNKLNLIEAGKNKKFHFFHRSATEVFNLSLPRLDYAVFTISDNQPEFIIRQSFANFLDFIKDFHPRILLVSSIAGYDKESHHPFLEIEKILAEYSHKSSVNARIVRLTAVYGPRMHFREDDPLIRLLKTALKNEPITESTPLDFSTRAIFIDDAIGLLIKAILHGNTSQKIYDGVLESPIKVAEIKQVLLDPLWHENRHFQPTELPPWPTPNLSKTKKELHWQAKTPLVTALKKTIHFFKEYPEYLEKEKSIKLAEKSEEKIGEKEPERSEEKPAPKRPAVKYDLGSKIDYLTTRFWLILALIFIGIFLIYPTGQFLGKVVLIPQHLQKSSQALAETNFPKAKEELNLSKEGINNLYFLLNKAAIFKQIPLTASYFAFGEQFLQTGQGLVDAASYTITGSEAFYLALKSLSGEEDLNQGIEKANHELNLASKQLAFVKAKLTDEIAQKNPQPVKDWLGQLEGRVDYYLNLVDRLKTISYLVSLTVPKEGSKHYLVLLMDNRQLRLGGGKIVSFAQVSFKNQKLTTVKSGTVAELDKKLADNLVSKDDFDQSNASLQNANFEVDFIANARLAAWFYQKEAQVAVAGVVMLDLSTLQALLQTSGPINLSSEKPGQVISAETLLEQANNPATLAATLEELINRTFFLPKQNWQLIAQTIDELLLGKHLAFYLNDQTGLSYLLAENFLTVFPQGVLDKKGERQEFLSLAEIDLGNDKQAIFSKRDYQITTKITEGGQVSHELNVQLDNLSVDKLRLKLYLAAGSKATRITWNNKDVLKQVSSFADYGRAGYSLLVTPLKNEKNQLSVEFIDLKSLDFLDNKINLSWNLIKQMGTVNDTFSISLEVPPSLRLMNGKNQTQVKGDFVKDQLINFDLKKVTPL